MTFRRAKKTKVADNVETGNEAFLVAQKEWYIRISNAMNALEKIRDLHEQASDTYKAYDKFIREAKLVSHVVSISCNEVKQLTDCLEFAIECHQNPTQAGRRAADLKEWFAESSREGMWKGFKGALCMVVAVTLGAVGLSLLMAGMLANPVSLLMGFASLPCIIAAGLAGAHGCRLFGDYRRMRKLYKAGEDLAETCHTGQLPAKS